MKYLSCVALSIIIMTTILHACRVDNANPTTENREYYVSSKPCTRWWWFATEIKQEDVRHQLDWVKSMQFGGVEIAWVFPMYRYQLWFSRLFDRFYPKDTTAQEWLSEEWSDIVAFTKSYADSIGLTCDFTFGTAWPVATDNVQPAYASQIYGDTSFRQHLTFAWTWPDTLTVINHLDSNTFNWYAAPMADALKNALQGSKSALFTDSWEIKLNDTHKIWTGGFEDSFKAKFGYDIIPFMDLGIDNFPDVRYDYMLLIDEYVTNGFYKPYVRTCRSLGAFSRVQCLASPTDVMTTYSLVDIPETEAMLNNPNYSRIVSSSACLSEKNLVSCEAFTCVYGFPSTYIREEQVADLKMVADALFAQGVNHMFYHGTPYNPIGSDSINFFATSHFGPGGSLENDLPAFNKYIEKVSAIMRRGKTYSDVAVYIPYEDGVMKGAYPPDKQRVWVWGEYELRHIYPPEETIGYHPLWINRHFLESSTFKNGRLVIGDAAFSTLYIDVKYMDERSLRRVLVLAKSGLPVCLKQRPTQPGKKKWNDYDAMIDTLMSLENVSDDFHAVVKHAPLIQSDQRPDFWCRVGQDGTHFIFFAQTLSRDLKYPVYSGQSFKDQNDTLDVDIHIEGVTLSQTLTFKPYQSMMISISTSGQVDTLDIYYKPPDPVIRPREKQKMYF